MNSEDLMMEFYYDFGERKFFHPDELTPERIEMCKNSDGEISGWTEFSFGDIECVISGKKLKGNVRLSAKNRYIKVLTGDMRNEREYKIDYADRPFAFSADVDSGIITLDNFSMNLKTKDYRGKITPYNFNRAILLMKCADEAFEQGVTVTPPVPSSTLLPFRLDNRTRFQYNIEVAPLYKQYAAQDRSLTIDMKNIRCSKYNDYGDIINAGTYNLHCDLCSTSQIFEIMKLQASWVETRPYIETLFIGIENYAPVLGELTSPFSIEDYEMRDDFMKSEHIEIYAHSDLYGCKYIYGDPVNYVLHCFKDESLTAGTSFELENPKQYYSVGEFLLILQKNFAEAKEKMFALIEEATDTQGQVKCPVCGTYNAESTNVCKNCLFDDLSPVFLNRDDALNWEQEVVAPYREKYASGKVIQFRRE